MAERVWIVAGTVVLRNAAGEETMTSTLTPEQQEAVANEDDMSEARDYLIWSNEHSGWWGHNEIGYVRRLGDAGRYSRERAMEICLHALPGCGSVPNELPVRAADMQELCDRDADAYTPEVPRPWR
jgi:hypothetical protein